MTYSKKERAWRETNAERLKVYRREHGRKQRSLWRAQVFAQYGNKCACCGFSDISFKLFGRYFLQIDHINGVEGRRRGEDLLRKLVREGFPEGYRILCASCNTGMPYGGDKCVAHKHWLPHCEKCCEAVKPEKPHRRIYAIFERTAVGSIASAGVVVLLKMLGL